MLIRPAHINDLPAIDEIYNHAISIRASAELSPYSEESRYNWYKIHEPEKYPIFVGVINNQVIGWLSFSPYRPGRMALRYTSEISYYLHPGFQRQGFGSQLIEFALHIAPEYDFRVLFAIIMEHNTASIHLLEKYKFEQWGFLPKVADYDGERRGQYYYGIIIS